MKFDLLTDYSKLLFRYIFRSLPPDEKVKLEKHVEESDELMYVFEESTDYNNYSKAAPFLDDIDLKGAYARVKAKGKGRMKFKVTASASFDFPAQVIQFNKWPKPFKYAAGLITIALAAFFMTFNRGKSKTPFAENNTQKAKTEQVTGKVASVLPIQLTADSVINVKNIKEGEVISNGDFIAHMKNGQLNCSIRNKTGVGQSHTFVTPSGTTAKVLLPDASYVSLNALSSLKIIADKGGVLKVIISGEAFIESSSSPSSHLFLEIKDRMTIEIAKQTQLNITAYPDETSILTSILKGDGESRISAGGKTAFLHSNQQAKFRGDSLTITNMDAVAADVTKAWTQGNFDFSYNFETMMSQIGRWYDLDIEYVNNEIPVKTFNGSLRRNTNNLSDMLKVLEWNGYDIKLDGRKLIVAGMLKTTTSE